VVLAVAALALPATAEAQLRLEKCDAGRCGALSVPLDRSGQVPGRLSLRVRLAPALRAPRRSATVLLAGGPGQSGVSAFIGGLFSDAWANDWRVLAPRNAVVTFDQRGTGAGALRCRDLEVAALSDAGREAEACAVKLGRRRALFRTSDSVADIEALRAALGVDKLTIVGASYGTYVAQRYALAHPDRVERLVLDSVLDATGVDPLYLDTAAAARRMLAAFCRRACRSFTDDAVADTYRLTQRLATAPLRGVVVDQRGRRRPKLLSREELLFVLISGDLDPLSRADYPAAVVSALRGDSAALMRLKRRAIGGESGLPPSDISTAAYAATSCEEVRFPWAWRAPPGERAGAAGRVEASLDPDLAFPFDPGTLVRNDEMKLCRRWPTLSPGPPADPGPMPNVPVLLLNGTEDLRTPLETARRAAARFPRAHLLAIPGVGHSVIGSSPCADRALHRFFDGHKVQKRCPPESPFFEPSRPAPASLADVERMIGVGGRRGRIVTALGLTLSDMFDDVLARAFADFDAFLSDDVLRGGGLRGGSWTLGENVFRMERLEYVPGVRLSATAVGADLNTLRMRVDGPGRLDGRMTLAAKGDEDLLLDARGVIGGRRLRTVVPLRVRFLSLFGFGEARGSAAALRWPLRPRLLVR
jgi:pimeloyl-ACP methyl ester carboxylesterase